MTTVECVIDYIPDAIAGHYWVKIGRNLETKPVAIVEQFEIWMQHWTRYGKRSRWNWTGGEKTSRNLIESIGSMAPSSC